MREFSAKEQRIIREKLVNGSDLPGLFPDDFLRDGKLMIQINEDGNHRFEFFSDTIPAQRANEELVDVINLLKYLDKEGLITKYPPAATSLRDFEIDHQISIGDAKSENKSESYLLIKGAANLVEFLKDNDNYIFQVTEPLRVLSHNRFLTLQERQFAITERLTMRGQYISVGIALATLLATTIFNIIAWKRTDKSMESFKADLAIVLERQKSVRIKDSLLIVAHDFEISQLKNQMDSLNKALKRKAETVQKKLSIKPTNTK